MNNSTFETTPYELVSFDETADCLGRLSNNTHPSEIHGYLSGQLSAGNRPAVEDWLEQISEQLGNVSFDHFTESLLRRMFSYTLGKLLSGSFSIRILIPDDQDDLAERTRSLGIWCQSFVSGFGENMYNQEITAVVQEVLRDFTQISQIETSDETEESEKLFMEVSEFVKIAWLNVFAEVPEKCTHDTTDTIH